MRPLIDLLGARWQLGSKQAPMAVRGVAWDADGEMAAFALADGTLAIVPRAWDGSAALRPRDDGGVEVVPPRGAPPPAMRVGVPGGVVASDATGFLCAGADGSLTRCSTNGALRPVLSAPTAAAGAAPLLATAGTACAVADGTRVRLRPAASPGQAPAADAPDGAATGWQELELPAAATALAFDPQGGLLAAAHAGGVTLCDGARALTLPLDGTPACLAWRPDGGVLTAGLTDASLIAWRVADRQVVGPTPSGAAPGALAWACGADAVAATDTGEVVCWRIGPDGFTPLPCGVASRVAASAVACHPRRPVVAAGYQNGAVTLCQPGSVDALFVRAADGAAIACLAYAPHGEALALATVRGELGVLALPATLFRDRIPAEAAP